MQPFHRPEDTTDYHESAAHGCQSGREKCLPISLQEWTDEGNIARIGDVLE